MNFLIFLTVLIFLTRLILKSAKYKGRQGEKRVFHILSSLASNDHLARVYQDVILKTPDGSTQVDHVFISTRGIFVIETKNMTGWIFGGEKQKSWTQVIYKKKTKFQNPIHQNYKHIKAVQNLLKVGNHVLFNVVVFSGDATLKTQLPSNVLQRRHLKRFIRSFDQELLSPKEVDQYATLIQQTISGSSITNKQHIRNVKNTRVAPNCPKCGYKMIMRTAQKGQKKGKKFWGCSNFPACRSIKSIE